MKAMLFHIGRERYALPLAAVLRVLPVARLKALPGAPHYVPGLLDLHGEPVPVVDLSRLAGTPPDAVRYDTRILLVEVPALGRLRRLGLTVSGCLAGGSNGGRRGGADQDHARPGWYDSPPPWVSSMSASPIRSSMTRSGAPPAARCAAYHCVSSPAT